ncbi:hypothetical protein Tsubulata_017808, partial [Turnera subulata]
MGGFLMQFVVVMVILSVVHTLLAEAQAIPGCNSTCGELTIPYPFGVEENCYLSMDFLITCNYSFNPPQAFLRRSQSVKVKNISIDGNLSIDALIARDCYGKDWQTTSVWSSLDLKSQFTISETRNKFVVVGCDSYGQISGFRGNGSYPYTSGCRSRCETKEAVDVSSCSGSGCCQIGIPSGLFFANVSAYSFNEHRNVSGFNNCTYAFVIEEGQFDFSMASLENIPQVNPKLPVVLEWSVRDAPGSACLGNATSYHTNNTLGYRCKCNDGYQGNPYLPSPYGCQGSAIGFTGLVIAASWLYIVLKQRKLVKLKEKFFRQNGGYILQHQLSGREGTSNMAKIFTAEELKKATNDFDESTILGRGGFGTVYKGTLTDSRVVAIKKSILVDRSQVEQFINEVVVLSQIVHRNIVRLLGCCLETEVPLLVYEFINNGTLSAYLHDKTNPSSSAYPWEKRLRIAAETAGALSYLHSSASVSIIHRD